jgi:protein unc-80
MPLLILCKSILILSEDFYVDLISITWNLLLNSDQEVASSAAVLFLISSMKQPSFVEKLLFGEFKSSKVDKRYNALLKFAALWRFRYHIWPRLEQNAHNMLKISPPCIDFVLPSPLIGLSSIPVSDPPWMPKAKAKMEEVTINQEEARAVVTASKSRKKHQQEILFKAMQADQLNKKIERENFKFTNINYLQHASYEPFLHQSKEEQEDGKLLILFFFRKVILN